MKDLIVVIGDDKYQFDTKDEVVQLLLGNEDEEYSDLPEAEKAAIRHKKAYINCHGQEDRILNLKQTQQSKQSIPSLDDKFLIDDDYTYVLSLISLDQLLLLERTGANIFTKNLDKSNIQDNYIIVNSFAKELLKNYQNDLLSTKDTDLEK